MKIPAYTMTMTWWKYVALTISILLSFYVWSLRSAALADNQVLIDKMIELDNEFDSLTCLPGQMCVNPAQTFQTFIHTRLAADERWILSEKLRYLWAITIVFAFPYIRFTKKDEAKV
ncbi:MAG: hypothetical protein ACTSW1_07235 [Candidatus Hodarchaeales archaeon]